MMTLRFIFPLLAFVSLTQSLSFMVEESRDLTDDEVSMIYGHVIARFKEANKHDAVERAEKEFEAVKAASSTVERNRILHNDEYTETEIAVGTEMIVDYDRAFYGMNKACRPSAKSFGCVKAFNKVLNKFVGLLANDGQDICQKPDDKRQRSYPNCCGKGDQISGLGYSCCENWWDAVTLNCPLINCCGATQSWDNWCYADHGSDPYIDGEDVCPVDKWTCSRFAGIVSGDLCASNSGNCALEIFHVVADIGEIIASVTALLFTGGASEGVEVAIKAGADVLEDVGEEAARKAVVTTLRTSIRTGMKGASTLWKNLSTNMKGFFEKLPENLFYAVIQEHLVVNAVKQHEFDVGKLAWDIASVVDPTGIVAFVNYLENGQQECKYAKPPTDAEVEAMEKAHEETLKYTCAPRTKSSHCPDIHDRDTCLATKDNRPEYEGQWCVWCLGESCTATDSNLCEPLNWLVNQEDFNDYETCAPQSRVFSRNFMDAGGDSVVILCIEINIPDTSAADCERIAEEQPNNGFSTTACSDDFVDACPNQVIEEATKQLETLDSVCPTAVVTTKCQLPKNVGVFSRNFIDAGGSSEIGMGVNLCIGITIPDTSVGNCEKIAGEIPNNGYSTTVCSDDFGDSCPNQLIEEALSQLTMLTSFCPTAVFTTKCQWDTSKNKESVLKANELSPSLAAPLDQGMFMQSMASPVTTSQPTLPHPNPLRRGEMRKDSSWQSTQSWSESLRYYPTGKDADDNEAAYSKLTYDMAAPSEYLQTQGRVEDRVTEGPPFHHWTPFNAIAAMDNRLVILLAVIGICSVVFYGVQYTRKLFAKEYTPIIGEKA